MQRKYFCQKHNWQSFNCFCSVADASRCDACEMYGNVKVLRSIFQKFLIPSCASETSPMKPSKCIKYTQKKLFSVHPHTVSCGILVLFCKTCFFLVFRLCPGYFRSNSFSYFLSSASMKKGMLPQKTKQVDRNELVWHLDSVIDESACSKTRIIPSKNISFFCLPNAKQLTHGETRKIRMKRGLLYFCLQYESEVRVVERRRLQRQRDSTGGVSSAAGCTSPGVRSGRPASSTGRRRTRYQQHRTRPGEKSDRLISASPGNTTHST